MARQPITKAALARIFRERMDEHPECPADVLVEIRQVRTSDGVGWSAVTSQADTLAHIDCARIVGALTLELRSLYELSDQ